MKKLLVVMLVALVGIGSGFGVETKKAKIVIPLEDSRDYDHSGDMASSLNAWFTVDLLAEIYQSIDDDTFAISTYFDGGTPEKAMSWYQKPNGKKKVTIKVILKLWSKEDFEGLRDGVPMSDIIGNDYIFFFPLTQEGKEAKQQRFEELEAKVMGWDKYTN